MRTPIILRQGDVTKYSSLSGPAKQKVKNRLLGILSDPLANYTNTTLAPQEVVLKMWKNNPHVESVRKKFNLKMRKSYDDGTLFEIVPKI